MKVLISCVGPAGLTVAYWLRRYGYSATIVERAPTLLVGGYKIDVRGGAAKSEEASRLKRALQTPFIVLIGKRVRPSRLSLELI
jgi:2-polyprenyl-6-methoxyphenol hydroxylase-like FAD-dependent oxidoreductase